MDRQLRQKVRQDFYEWKNLVNNFNRFDTRHPLLNILENNQELFSCRVAKGLFRYIHQGRQATPY